MKNNTVIRVKREMPSKKHDPNAERRENSDKMKKSAGYLDFNYINY